MSIQKNTAKDGSTPRTDRRIEAERDVEAGGTAIEAVEIVSLEIAEDPDAGGDPYNRTGSFCVIKDVVED
jgi:hypothetical protein